MFRWHGIAYPTSLLLDRSPPGCLGDVCLCMMSWIEVLIREFSKIGYNLCFVHRFVIFEEIVTWLGDGGAFLPDLYFSLDVPIVRSLWIFLAALDSNERANDSIAMSQQRGIWGAILVIFVYFIIIIRWHHKVSTVSTNATLYNNHTTMIHRNLKCQFQVDSFKLLIFSNVYSRQYSVGRCFIDQNVGDWISTIGWSPLLIGIPLLTTWTKGIHKIMDFFWQRGNPRYLHGIILKLYCTVCTPVCTVRTKVRKFLTYVLPAATTTYYSTSTKTRPMIDSFLARLLAQIFAFSPWRVCVFFLKKPKLKISNWKKTFSKLKKASLAWRESWRGSTRTKR